MSFAREVPKERIHRLNDAPVRSEGSFVLYWMQQSQRSAENPALAFALELGKQLKKPVLVCFGLTGRYPGASWPHFRFMAEGLLALSRRFREMGISFVVRTGPPDEVAAGFSGNASCVVCDVGYLRHQWAWRRSLAENAGCRVFAVEGDVVVPVHQVMARRAYAAYVLRPKIRQQVDRFASPVRMEAPVSWKGPLPEGEDLTDPDSLLMRAGVPRIPMPEAWTFAGGEEAANALLSRFIKDTLSRYADDRNLPHRMAVSRLSPYLHFGMISPVSILQAVQGVPGGEPGKDAFLEELIVRRELAMNFVTFSGDYDQYGTLPEWARESLFSHRNDPRPVIYDMKTLTSAQTADPYWNAAMKEMLLTGYMHNYMRMYWGKKILEWSPSPEVAFERLLYLNDRYFLDGRDPNSYAGCGWIFGLHDRAWFERPVFGKIRYMAATGLERKCRIGKYVSAINDLEGKAPELPFG